MSTEIIPQSPRTDCDEIFDEVARPLFDLRDSSMHGIEQYRTSAGDLQSQMLLAYGGSESEDRVFSRSLFTSNLLGTNKLIQAFYFIPLIIGGLAAIQMPAMTFAYHLGTFAYFALALTHLALVSSASVLIIALSILITRRSQRANFSSLRNFMKSVMEPDHIAISPQGINLQWSGKFYFYMGLVLPWKRIALAYCEEHRDAETGEIYEVLCLRDNLGKALRLDCRVFASEVLKTALAKRAPWSVKAPPMVLALQPLQQTSLVYLYSWAYTISRTLSKFGFASQYTSSLPQPSALVVDDKSDVSDVQSIIQLPGESISFLKKGTYRVLQTIRAAKFGMDHICQVCSHSKGESKPLALRALNESETNASSISSRVRVRQFVLPPKQSPMEWYWLLKRFEHQVRRLSDINNNHVSRWLDVFLESGSLFVVTEYDAAPTFREIVKAGGPFPEARVRETALEMCEILQHLHQLDVPYIHKAFTPDCLVLADGNFVKLNEFPIAVDLLPSKFSAIGLDRRYMPLEQLRGYMSTQSDLYAFGGTLFFLLTGEDPKPLKQSDVRSLRPEVSEAFNAIIMKATEPTAHNRYESVAAIKEAILELANSETNLLLL